LKVSPHSFWVRFGSREGDGAYLLGKRPAASRC
jgi:hypothetical protein